MLFEAHFRRALWLIITVLIHGRLLKHIQTRLLQRYQTKMKFKGPACNVYYPGFKRNFWLEFSSPSPSSPAPPPPTHPPPPRPLFLSPGKKHHHYHYHPHCNYHQPQHILHHLDLYSDHQEGKAIKNITTIATIRVRTINTITTITIKCSWLWSIYHQATRVIIADAQFAITFVLLTIRVMRKGSWERNMFPAWSLTELHLAILVHLAIVAIAHLAIMVMAL